MNAFMSSVLPLCYESDIEPLLLYYILPSLELADQSDKILRNSGVKGQVLMSKRVGEGNGAGMEGESA